MAPARSPELVGTIELRRGPEVTRLSARVPRGAVVFAEVLPVAHQLSDALISTAVARSEKDGKPVSCRAGCAACCRQGVPIGHAEARRLSRLVDEMPEPRRSEIRGRFEQAMAKLRGTDLLERYDALAATCSDEESSEWAFDYFRRGIACPFLERESCSIHPERPLVCREYLVTNSPARCADLPAGGIEGVGLDAWVQPVVFELGQEGPKSVLLVTLLEWISEHRSEPERRTGLEWVRGLQQKLNQIESKASEPHRQSACASETAKVD